MAKATKALPATTRVLNRRALLRGGATATIAAAAPVAVTASPTSLAAQPTALGRAMLAAVAEYRAAWAAGSLPDDVADDATDRVYATIKPLIRQIEAQPVTSLANLVDRAIAAAAYLSPDDDIESERMMPLVQAVCSMAGLQAREITIC